MANSYSVVASDVPSTFVLAANVSANTPYFSIPNPTVGNQYYVSVTPFFGGISGFKDYVVDTYPGGMQLKKYSNFTAYYIVGAMDHTIFASPKEDRILNTTFDMINSTYFNGLVFINFP